MGAVAREVVRSDASASGDIPATWESLRRQVRAGLSIAVSGIPWWTTDIGGFHGGDPRDPAYQELVVRWFQYGAFCPLFRLHGDREPRVPTGHAMTGGPNEVWSYGDAAYERIAAVLRLRERLRPYIHEQMRVASRDGMPPMRPLFMDFPKDQDAWRSEDEFLFGPDLLIAPVLEPGVELARATGEQRYLELARLFIERRGTGTLGIHPFGQEYFQDDMPVRRATVMRGHAVRALYLASGALDVAAETGDAGLLDAVREQWANGVARRTYLTGGVGSHHQDEAFGDDFELPPDRAYAETCAGIAARGAAAQGSSSKPRSCRTGRGDLCRAGANIGVERVTSPLRVAQL